MSTRFGNGLSAATRASVRTVLFGLDDDAHDSKKVETQVEAREPSEMLHQCGARHHVVIGEKAAYVVGVGNCLRPANRRWRRLGLGRALLIGGLKVSEECECECREVEALVG